MEDNKLEKLAYRVPDAAEELGISESKLHRLMTEGKIQGRKIDTVTVVLRSELERFLSETPAR